MKLIEAAQLLNAVGRKTVCHGRKLEQVVEPYESYYLLKEEEGKWIYGLFIQEKTNKPYLTDIETLATEEEGSKFFLLKQLSRHYFDTVIKTFLSRKDLYIYDDTFDIPRLRYALSVAGVPKDLFYVDRKPSHCAIVLETNGNHYIISFYGQNGKKVSSSLPLELREALFFVFQKVVKLYLFETEVLALLKKENINVMFSDEDVNCFLSIL
ncbi:hypothetical protein NSQ26_04525 [Bacillus sp. FSL W7-1360]